MTRVAYYWTMGGIVAIVVMAVFGGNPIAAIIGSIAGGLAIDRLEKHWT